MSEKSFNIKLTAIELIQKTMNPPPQDISDKPEFNFNFLVDLKLNKEQKIGIVFTDISIATPINEQHIEVGRFKVVMGFELPDFDTIFKKVGEKLYDIPIELEIILKSAGISTVRGILFSELKGTYLQSALLPLIDMATLITNQRTKAETDIKK